jgi:hypothetical protein
LPNDAGLDTRCQFPDDVGLLTIQGESSSVRVLAALVKAERKRAAALENVDEFLKQRKEQSDALFTQAKQEMEEARKKLADAEQAKHLMLSKTVVNPIFLFIIARFNYLSSQHACCDVGASTEMWHKIYTFQVM